MVLEPVQVRLYNGDCPRGKHHDSHGRKANESTRQKVPLLMVSRSMTLDIISWGLVIYPYVVDYKVSYGSTVSSMSQLL